jgi:hypothetical protein
MSTRQQRQHRLDGPVRCHYAADPVRRPRCALAAVVQYGQLPLCGPCHNRRSNVG